jgi:hypothetical protein
MKSTVATCGSHGEARSFVLLKATEVKPMILRRASALKQVAQNLSYGKDPYDLRW